MKVVIRDPMDSFFDFIRDVDGVFYPEKISAMAQIDDNRSNVGVLILSRVGNGEIQFNILAEGGIDELFYFNRAKLFNYKKSIDIKTPSINDLSFHVYDNNKIKFNRNSDSRITIILEREV